MSLLDLVLWFLLLLKGGTFGGPLLEEVTESAEKDLGFLERKGDEGVGLKEKRNAGEEECVVVEKKSLKFENCGILSRNLRFQ